MRYLLTLLIIALPIVLAVLGLDGWVIAVVGCAACLAAAVCVVMTADLDAPPPVIKLSPPQGGSGTARMRIDPPHRTSGPHSDDGTFLPFRRG